MTEVLLETFMLPDSEADLFEELRRAGYEPKRGEIVETRDAHLPDIVLRIVEDVGHDAAMVLLGVAIEWVRGTLRGRIWGESFSQVRGSGSHRRNETAGHST